MKKVKECKNMQDIRFAIDQIDKKIVESIALRAEYVHEAAKFKNSESEVKDDDRVKNVIESKKALADKYGISPVLISNIYKIMIDFFINEEMKEWKYKKGNLD